MIDNREVIALIPARGGSKRLPQKNILNLGDKPLIAWTVEAAKQSEYIDHVVVTSDDKKILEISSEYGADKTIARPLELALDNSTTNDVVLHAIDTLGIASDGAIIVVLQPTSPFRSSEDIDASLELLVEKNATGVVSVCECEHSPLWSNSLPDDMNMGDFISKVHYGKRSQDLPTFYRLNGAIYAYDVATIIQTNALFYSDKVYAYVMEQRKSIDIDTQLDFDFAKFFIEQTA